MRMRDLIPALALFVVFGCGGGGGGGGNPVSVSVNPPTANLAPNGGQQFTATVSNATNTAVTWSVIPALNGGTVSLNGFYTAPGTTGTYQVKATSVQDPTKSDTSTITVAANVTVTVNPPAPTISVGDTQNFTATVQGAVNQAVTWSVDEGVSGGSVSATGVYTAPGTPNTYHVRATSQADPTKSATATVTVQAGNAAGTIQ